MRRGQIRLLLLSMIILLALSAGLKWLVFETFLAPGQAGGRQPASSSRVSR